MEKEKALELTAEDRAQLKKILRMGTIQAQIAAKARILLLSAEGETVEVIAEKVMASETCVQLCLKKYKEGGIENVFDGNPYKRGETVELD